MQKLVLFYKLPRIDPCYKGRLSRGGESLAIRGHGDESHSQASFLGDRKMESGPTQVGLLQEKLSFVLGAPRGDGVWFSPHRG